MKKGFHMKTCIVTVYNSENCGSFLQSYALAKILEREGHEVSFLYRNIKGTSHDFNDYFISCIKLLLRGRIKRLKSRIIAYRGFSKAISQFHIIKFNSSEYETQDIIIIGSDTLWNFDDEYFYNKKNIYSGYDFKGKPAFSYASSVANTNKMTLLSDEIICKGIRSLKAVSARDDYTANIVYSITGVRPCIVLDPTLLLTSDDYGLIEGKCNLKEFLLIYSFKKLSEDMKKQILDVKKKYNVCIVAFGNYREWADVNVPFEPHSFLAYYKKSKYIITDTYHGTLFSIIYKKAFVCLGQHKNKVRDILTTLNLTDRFVSEEEHIISKIEHKIDYDQVFNFLEQARNDSISYLKTSMMGD